MSQRIFNSNSCRILFATCLSALCLAALSAEAATVTVINSADGGPGSLRQALADANDGDTINFSVTGTITLTSGELVVDKSVTISGPGAANLAVNGNAASRIFHISAGKTVTISGLTITNGSASGAYTPASYGGGIYNEHATLTVSSCAVSDNVAELAGGGIYSDGIYGSATLTVDNSTLSGNSAAYSAGGILNNGSFGSATLTLNNSTVMGNSVPDGSGGGIGNGCNSGSATLTLNNSTLSDNSALDSGGIFNAARGSEGSATLTLNNSTLSGNSAQTYGGGIVNNGGEGGSATLTLNNSTLSGNSVPELGGGIVNYGYYGGSATLTLNNSTLSGNSASNGGGIYNDGRFSGSVTLDLTDTILNAGASGENVYNFASTVTSHGYNLSSDAAAGDGTTGPGGLLNATGDIRNTDPMLGPLQDNGGPTFTHELLSRSPAIDTGDPNFNPNNFNPPMVYDQRGTGSNRVANGRIDIGAFEVQASRSVCPQPQGYWKSNPEAWPVNSLTLGSQTYTKTELLIILNTPIGSGRNADASLILAHQLIAAKLNVANGSDPAPVSSTITHADSLLSGYSGKLPYRVKPSSANGQAMVNDATVLNNYNNGALTAGCTP